MRAGLKRARGGVVAAAAALAFAVVVGATAANYSLYQHVSVGEINGNQAFDDTFSGASADGTRVYFETDEQLVSGDTDASQDVYERSGGATELVSVGDVNGNGAFDAAFAGMSADGLRVFFVTGERLLSGDTDSAQDVYERSAGTTRRISAGQVNGNGPFPAFFAGASADGTHVFFQTDESLVSGDTDASQDLYDRSGGTTKRVSGGQVNGNGAFGAFFEYASADGKHVFFRTHVRLVPSDTDAVPDI